MAEHEPRLHHAPVLSGHDDMRLAMASSVTPDARHDSVAYAIPVFSLPEPASKRGRIQRKRRDGKDAAVWTNERDIFMLDFLKDVESRGLRTNCGWKPEAWTQVVDAFNRRFGMDYTEIQIKHRIQNLRTKYLQVRTLRERPGFHWDEGRFLLSAPDELWEKVERVCSARLIYQCIVHF